MTGVQTCALPIYDYNEDEEDGDDKSESYGSISGRSGGSEAEVGEVDDYEDDVLEVAPPIVPAPVDLKVSRKAALKPKVTTILSDVNESMPHNIECPSDLEAFDGLVDEFVHNAADLRALIDRILVWNSVNLPGKQGADNKNKMHNFMDILLKLFVREADALSTAILPAEVSAIQQQVSQ